MRKSWRPTWKKPKKDSPEAAPSPRNPITKSFAALRKSVPDGTAAAPLSDAKTPLRSSTGPPHIAHLLISKSVQRAQYV